MQEQRPFSFLHSVIMRIWIFRVSLLQTTLSRGLQGLREFQVDTARGESFYVRLRFY